MVSPSVREQALLPAIVLAGATLRFFPIWFGLPSLLARPDEETALNHAMAIAGGDLNPHFFHWPSLAFYVFAALFKGASLIKGVAVHDPALTDIQQVLIARAFVAFAGTVTIALLYWLGRQTADATTGLLAAAFLAVSILHVRESHFAMTDVLATLLITLHLALVVRALSTAMTAPRLPSAAIGWFALAGFVGGLATSTKYSAAAAVASIVAAQAVWVRHATVRWRLATWAPLCVALFAFVLGFIVATPYAVIDYQTFAADVWYDVTHLSGGHGIDLGRGWSYHLLRSLPYGVGIAVFCAALAGIVPMVRHHRRHAIVLGVFAVVFYASIGSGKAVFFRYVLPLVPIVCLSAAVAVRHLASWLASRTHLSLGWALAVPTLLIAGPSFVSSGWLDELLARTDTRVIAGRWLSARTKEEETVHESCGVYARIHMEHTSFHRWAFDPATRSFGDPWNRTPDWLVVCDSPIQYTPVPPELHRVAADKYVLVEVVVGATQKTGAVYDAQDAFFLPLSGFSTVRRPGPTVFIYRRGDAPPAR
jgi:hypothetical protein